MLGMESNFEKKLLDLLETGSQRELFELIESGSCPIDYIFLDKTNILHKAISLSLPIVAYFVLSRSVDGCELLAQVDKFGNTPVELAAAYGYSEIIAIFKDFLLSEGNERLKAKLERCIDLFFKQEEACQALDQTFENIEILKEKYEKFISGCDRYRIFASAANFFRGYRQSFFGVGECTDSLMPKEKKFN